MAAEEGKVNLIEASNRVVEELVEPAVEQTKLKEPVVVVAVMDSREGWEAVVAAATHVDGEALMIEDPCYAIQSCYKYWKQEMLCYVRLNWSYIYRWFDLMIPNWNLNPNLKDIGKVYLYLKD